MPVVPLAIDAYKRQSGFLPETRCVNFYLEEDKSSPDGVARLQRPGLTRAFVFPSPIRGLFQQDGVMGSNLYAVAGTYFYKVTATGLVNLGDVTAGTGVSFAAAYGTLFIRSGTRMYYGSSVNPPVRVFLPETRAVQDIETINSYLIAGCPDGRFYWLEPGQTVVDALNFATAESSADGLEAVRRLADEIWFFGKSTIEVWQLSGSEDAPFLRAGGRTLDIGCLAKDTVQRFDNNLVWVGIPGQHSGFGENPMVYRSGNVPIRISDHGIEERLRKRTARPSAMTLEHDGHKWYILTIPGQGSFAYDAATEKWAEFDWANGAPFCSTGGYIGDQLAGVVYRFDPASNKDDGVVFERLVTGTVPINGVAARVDSLSVGAGGSEYFTLRVRWKDGRDDYPDHYEEVEVRAPYDIANLYRLGQPEQPFRTFEVSVIDNVQVRISGAVTGQAWR